MSERWVYRCTPQEVVGIQNAAHGRHTGARQQGVRNQRIAADATDDDVDTRGAMAEYAVSQLLHGAWEMSMAGDSNGADVWLTDGTSVEVKATMGRGRNLLFKGTDPRILRSDIAVLVWPAGRDAVELVGWIDRATFSQIASVRDLGYGPNIFVSSDDLFPMDDLSAWLQESQLTAARYAAREGSPA